MTHRIGHCRRGHLKHACGCTFEIYIERLGQSIAQRGYGCVAVEAHLAAEKTLRRKPSENHVRVSDRRLRSSPPITRRARLRACAARTDVETAAFIKPGNTTATGADFDDVENRDADRKPFVVTADEIIRRKARLAAPNHTGFGRRAAHVESDGGVEIQYLAERHRPDDATRRA